MGSPRPFQEWRTPQIKGKETADTEEQRSEERGAHLDPEPGDRGHGTGRAPAAERSDADPGVCGKSRK